MNNLYSTCYEFILEKEKIFKSIYENKVIFAKQIVINFIKYSTLVFRKTNIKLNLYFHIISFGGKVEERKITQKKLEFHLIYFEFKIKQHFESKKYDN